MFPYRFCGISGLVAIVVFVFCFTSVHGATFVDDFNRPDGPVGNGWLETNTSVHPTIDSGTLTMFPGSEAYGGICRPISLAGAVSASAKLSSESDPPFYSTSFRFGATDGTFTGHGIAFYGRSSVSLVDNGVTVSSIPSSFNFGSSINVFFTLDTGGNISGSVTENGQQFNFVLGFQNVVFAGSNFLIDMLREPFIPNQRIDNVILTDAPAVPEPSSLIIFTVLGIPKLCRKRR